MPYAVTFCPDAATFLSVAGDFLAAVAAVAASLRAVGARVCLFTDRANPTSNRIYAAIGFEPVTEMVHLELA